jgi:hypothetical protein
MEKQNMKSRRSYDIDHKATSGNIKSNGSDTQIWRTRGKLPHHSRMLKIFLTNTNEHTPSHSMSQNDNYDQDINVEDIYYYANDAARYFSGIPPIPPVPMIEMPLPPPNRRLITPTPQTPHLLNVPASPKHTLTVKRSFKQLKKAVSSLSKSQPN